MQQPFLVEAARYQVLPLDNSLLTRMIQPRPGPAAGRRQFVYTAPVSTIQANAASSILNRSYRITAGIEAPQGGANRMLITPGRPIFTMNLLNIERPEWEGAAALMPGRHTIVFARTPEPTGMPSAAAAPERSRWTASGWRTHSAPHATFTWDETLDVGLDTGTPVDDHDYQVPFTVTGRIDRVTVGDFARQCLAAYPARNFAIRPKRKQKTDSVFTRRSAAGWPRVLPGLIWHPIANQSGARRCARTMGRCSLERPGWAGWRASPAGSVP